MTGFNSKREAAADKLQEPVSLYVSKPALESWRGFASDYERGFIDGMKKQAQSSVDKAVNQMAQPTQEPVGEIRASSYGNYPVVAWVNGYVAKIGDKFYTTPPQREWVGLTDEDIHNTAGYSETREMYKFALALIAKLKEKNA